MTNKHIILTDSDGAKQTVWISFRTTLIEREELREHAYVARVSVSELVRRRVLGLSPPRPAVPSLNALSYAEIGRVESSLNQLVRLACESGQFAPAHLPNLQKVLNAYSALSVQLRRELIGLESVQKESC